MKGKLSLLLLLLLLLLIGTTLSGANTSTPVCPGVDVERRASWKRGGEGRNKGRVVVLAVLVGRAG